jgi:hypothetical protein
MIRSARRHGFTQDIHVLCLSDECEQAMHALAMPGVKLITLAILEKQIPRLTVAKANRTIVEYYFTCMAALHTYLFQTLPMVEGTMYVDADIQFFESPDIVFDAIGDAPAALTPHNFVPNMRHLEDLGRYNGGWSAFRRTAEGQACLNWWLERSLEWCYDRLDGERYANQKYMNGFAGVAPGTRILWQKGFNCAPWNIGNYRISECDGRIRVDDELLVFFHFHGVKRRLGYFEFQHREYGAAVSWLMRNKLYKPYIIELMDMERLYKSLTPAGGGSRATNLRGSDRKLGTLLGKIAGHPIKAVTKLIHLVQDLPVLIIGQRAI